MAGITGDVPRKAENYVSVEGNIPMLVSTGALGAELTDKTHFINIQADSGKKRGAFMCNVKLDADGKIAAAADYQLCIAKGSLPESGWSTYKAVSSVTPV